MTLERLARKVAHDARALAGSLERLRVSVAREDTEGKGFIAQAHLPRTPDMADLASRADRVADRFAERKEKVTT